MSSWKIPLGLLATLIIIISIPWYYLQVFSGGGFNFFSIDFGFLHPIILFFGGMSVILTLPLYILKKIGWLDNISSGAKARFESISSSLREISFELPSIDDIQEDMESPPPKFLLKLGPSIGLIFVITILAGIFFYSIQLTSDFEKSIGIVIAAIAVISFFGGYPAICKFFKRTPKLKVIAVKLAIFLAQEGYGDSGTTRKLLFKIKNYDPQFGVSNVRYRYGILDKKTKELIQDVNDSCTWFIPPKGIQTFSNIVSIKPNSEYIVYVSVSSDEGSSADYYKVVSVEEIEFGNKEGYLIKFDERNLNQSKGVGIIIEGIIMLIMGIISMKIDLLMSSVMVIGGLLISYKGYKKRTR